MKFPISLSKPWPAGTSTWIGFASPKVCLIALIVVSTVAGSISNLGNSLTLPVT